MTIIIVQRPTGDVYVRRNVAGTWDVLDHTGMHEGLTITEVAVYLRETALLEVLS